MEEGVAQQAPGGEAEQNLQQVLVLVTVGLDWDEKEDEERSRADQQGGPDGLEGRERTGGVPAAAEGEEEQAGASSSTPGGLLLLLLLLTLLRLPGRRAHDSRKPRLESTSRLRSSAASLCTYLARQTDDICTTTVQMEDISVEVMKPEGWRAVKQMKAADVTCIHSSTRSL